MNVAVSDLLLFSVTVTGLALPLTAPLQPANDDPTLAVAVTVTTVPEAYTPPGGFKPIVPLPFPVVAVVNV